MNGEYRTERTYPYACGEVNGFGEICRERGVSERLQSLTVNRIPLSILQFTCSRRLRSFGRDLFRKQSGGGTGIRTLGTLARTTVFETAPFNHSGIPPRGPDWAVAGAGRGPVERPAHYPKAPKARKTAGMS